MGHTQPALEPLFNPNAVAVVGASPTSWYASKLLENLTEWGYDGEAYPVNPKHDAIDGLRCYDELGDVPGAVDLAVVSVPRGVVSGVVREAAELGIPAALVVTAGFSEADEKGAALERELSEIVDEYDIRIAGPQSLGISNSRDGVHLSPAIDRRPDVGSTAIVSQSGGFGFTFLDRAVDEDIHPRYVVATGNEIDLTIADYIDYLAGEPDVDVICTFIEGLDDPKRYMGVVDDAIRGGTPVFTIKIGQSDAAETAAMSHTGSVLGDDAAWDAAFQQTGVERVDDLPDLLHRATAHIHAEPPASDNVCVVTTSGGYASLLADMADERGLSLPELTDRMERELLELDALLTFDELNNPVDIRGYGLDALPEIAEIVFADDSYDSYVFMYELSAVDEDAEQVADDFLTIAELATDPVMFLWSGRREPDEATPRATELPFERVRASAPLFADAEPCMDALASIVRFGEYRESLASGPSRAALFDEVTPRTPDGDLPSDSVLEWPTAASLLEAYDITPVETQLVRSASEAASAAAEVGFPVVLKVDSRDVPHRARAGAVVTDVDSEEMAREAYEQIRRNVATYDPDAAINGILVQSQVADGVETLVGTSTDEVFGQLVTIGTGGSLVEVIEDSATRVPPLSDADIDGLLEETRLPSLIRNAGLEGSAGLAAFEELVANVGDFAAETPFVSELDLNPIVVTEEDAVVVDILVRTGDVAAHDQQLDD